MKKLLLSLVGYSCVFGSLRYLWIGKTLNSPFKNGFLTLWSARVICLELSSPGSLLLIEFLAPFIGLVTYNTGLLYIFDYAGGVVLALCSSAGSIYEWVVAIYNPPAQATQRLLEQGGIHGPAKGQADARFCYTLWYYCQFEQINHFPPYCSEFAADFLPKYKQMTHYTNLYYGPVPMGELTSFINLENPLAAPGVVCPPPLEKPNASIVEIVVIAIFSVTLLVLLPGNC
jgi:hypothetical protein